MRGGPGGGLLAGNVLKTSATYLGMTVADLQTALKGGKTLAQVAAGTNGKSAAGLITALTNEAKDNLDAAVAAGWITQKQADAALEGITREITALVNNGPPVLPEKKAGPLEAAATYLGMSVDDIHTALKGGKTLAQLVTAPKTVDGLVAALTADAKTKLDKAVANGDLTTGPGDRDPEQADRAGDGLRQRRQGPEGRDDDDERDQEDADQVHGREAHGAEELSQAVTPSTALLTARREAGFARPHAFCLDRLARLAAAGHAARLRGRRRPLRRPRARRRG